MIPHVIPKRHAPFLALALAFTLGLATRGPEAGTSPGAPAAQAAPYDLLLRGGRIVDGSGNPWFEGDLAIRGERIAALGSLEGARAKRTIDARGLVVAPGFIDMLGQSEFNVLADPHVRSKITQGITTELTGEGGSVGPMTPFTIEEVRPSLSDLGIDIDWRDFEGYFRHLRTKGSAINFAHLVGATQVRMAVLKSDNRLATPAELETMKKHVARAMEQGAFGLSSSLIYTPAIFADTAELVELAKVAARYGGFYATHIRNEGERIIPAIEEAATIGERARAPVEIWHLKCSERQNWGRMPEALRAIEAARERGIDMTADIYPYPASATDLTACLPPSAKEGGTAAMLGRLQDKVARARIREEILKPAEDWENFFESTGPENILIAGVRDPVNRKFQGKRLSEVAAARGVDPIEAMFDLLVEEDGTVDAIYFSMSEKDVRTAMAAPWVSFNCDAPGAQPAGVLGERMAHPRAYGSFPRILGRYVRDEKVLALEDAVRKMTSLAAQRIGIRDRGLLRPGLFADVTVFDPKRVIDRATFEAPHQFSEGIVHVFVNGQAVIEQGRVTQRLPGRILRGPGYRSPASSG